MHTRAVERLDFEAALRRAVIRQQFTVRYQPVVELASGRLAGLEALVRWDHPERGLVMLGEFVGLAEDTGLIVPIGRWVLHAACQAARDWQRRFPLDRSPFLSVNLSVRQLQQPDLLEDVAGALDASGLALLGQPRGHRSLRSGSRQARRAPTGLPAADLRPRHPAAGGEPAPGGQLDPSRRCPMVGLVVHSGGLGAHHRRRRCLHRRPQTRLAATTKPHHRGPRRTLSAKPRPAFRNTLLTSTANYRARARSTVERIGHQLHRALGMPDDLLGQPPAGKVEDRSPTSPMASVRPGVAAAQA
jgi:hypothetical protein